MPKPKKDESKQDFLSRCTKELIKQEDRPAEQAYKLCNVYWDETYNQRAALTLSAPLELESDDGDGDPKSFMITAYTGRSIGTGSGKVIFDVNGMKAKAKFPVLREHARDRIVGLGTKTWKDESHLFMRGDFAKDSQDAIEVKSLAMQGFPWQASVGIWPEKIKVLDSEKETAIVNGQEVKGPIEIWTQSHVGEVSFVALGADDETAAVVLSGDQVLVTIEGRDVNLEPLLRMEKDKLGRGGSVMPKAVEVLESKDRMFKEAEIIAFLDTLEKDQLTDENRELVLGSFKLMGMVKDQLPEKFVENLIKAVPELKDIFIITETKEVKIPVDEKKIRQEIKAELRKEMKLEKDAAIVELEGKIETFKEELGETKTALDKEREIRELVEIRTFIKDSNVPGDIEKVSRTILLARRANPEMAKDIENTLASAGAALVAAGVFSELGASGKGDLSDTAYKQLQKKVTEAMEKDNKLEQHKAWENVIRQNAELYKEYTAEQTAATKEVH